MSKLEELIQKLCPNGVEYTKLADLIKKREFLIVTPTVKVKRNDYMPSGKTPIISQELEYISGYSDLADSHIPNGEYICFGDHSEHIKYVNFSFVQGADGLKIIKNNSKKLGLKYFYYAICNNYIKHNNYERHFKYFADTAIPVPPIEVQEEIVQILDKFTELSAELSAELTARKKQYEFYRDKLLDEDNINQTVLYKSIGELCKLSAGGDIPKNRYSKIKTEVYNIPIFSNGIGKNALYGYTNQATIFDECVTISARGTIGYSELRTVPFYPIVRLICAIPNDEIVAKYLKYFLDTITFQTPKTGIPQLTVPMVAKIKIPVPPLAEQERIVTILDRFSKLCNDISAGLPAEIEARKKQYEYYRDKLLTFKELT